MGTRHYKLFIMFLLSFGLMVLLAGFLSGSGARQFDFSGGIWKLDYMLMFVPATGFFFVYFLIPYMRKEFGFGEMFIYAFPALFAIFSYLAYQLAAWWYYANQAFLASNGMGILPNGTLGSGAGCALFLCLDISAFGIVFMRLFIGSHFLYFAIAGVLGWASRLLMEHFGSPSGTG